MDRAFAAAAAAAAADDGLAGEGGAAEATGPVSPRRSLYGDSGGGPYDSSGPTLNSPPPPAAAPPVVLPVDDPGRLLIAGGDRQRVRPPRRLVVVVRGAPPEVLECTEDTDGGRFGLAVGGFVMMGAACCLGVDVADAGGGGGGNGGAEAALVGDDEGGGGGELVVVPETPAVDPLPEGLLFDLLVVSLLVSEFEDTLSEGGSASPGSSVFSSLIIAFGSIFASNLSVATMRLYPITH